MESMLWSRALTERHWFEFEPSFHCTHAHAVFRKNSTRIRHVSPPTRAPDGKTEFFGDDARCRPLRIKVRWALPETAARMRSRSITHLGGAPTAWRSG